MLLNSVNTNVGAMTALESLNETQMALQGTQKQISTGYRVADATDDGAAYAVAQTVRSNVAGLTAATQQLSSTAGLMKTTLNSLDTVSKTMSQVQAVLSELGNGSIASSQRSQYNSNLKNYVSEIKSALSGASYQGKNLVDNITNNLASDTTYTSVNIVQDERGTKLTVNVQGLSTVYNAINTLYNTLNTVSGASAAASAAGAVTATGSFTTAMKTAVNALDYYGNMSNFVDSQVSFNNNRIDALNTGLGALVDSNLSQEAAKLQALQTRQQLGTQALSIANQAPNSLLSLFR